MNTNTLQLLKLIKHLPLSEKLYLVELIFRQIREETLIEDKTAEARKQAAALLLEDYQTDEELTAFTVLDGEQFYETK